MRLPFGKNRRPSPESAGEVKISSPQGIHAHFARRVTEVARGYKSSAMLVDGHGRRANVHSLFELLLLGVCYGSSVQLHCVGDDADTAFAAIADVLGQDEVAT